DYQSSFIADLRITDLLERTMANAKKAAALITQKEPIEIIAFELQSLIDTLAEITGEITPDDILNSIFSRFCIGK
ncbi:tRNA uridine-5-carboxymethylaminomethyl(34) synthesis GTPase MnmE, partial [Spirochaetota bacterium]